ncbi:hypothetical protein K503DRAFT_783056 [Rhizopogon vinicolor AM-OR11-026]|uniref:Uncharacterized protein n=1 Tax=Rhizopogon vinicolor AM-OR11-026 TaxID=1314800 RepID=A0A1B7N039_9AGAM|nr:hypothetical protein K503DRAFT_783056 [Rhizopogon vinicolor AM-OR11-026]
MAFSTAVISAAATIRQGENALHGETKVWTLTYDDQDNGICMLANTLQGGFWGLKQTADVEMIVRKLYLCKRVATVILAQSLIEMTRVAVTLSALSSLHCNMREWTTASSEKLIRLLAPNQRYERVYNIFSDAFKPTAAVLLPNQVIPLGIVQMTTMFGVVYLSGERQRWILRKAGDGYTISQEERFWYLAGEGEMIKTSPEKQQTWKFEPTNKVLPI